MEINGRKKKEVYYVKGDKCLRFFCSSFNGKSSAFYRFVLFLFLLFLNKQTNKQTNKQITTISAMYSVRMAVFFCLAATQTRIITRIITN